MTAGTPRLVVVGGGVIGTMHAVEGVRRGYQVVQLERDVAPRGASVRNFGLVWVSGRADGAELDLALRARELWEQLAKDCPATGFRPAGSLTIASTDDELGALELAAAGAGAKERGFELLSARELGELEPALEVSAAAGRVLGALRCRLDAIVEPRRVPGALRDYLSASGRYSFLPERPVVDCRPHGVRDAAGIWHEADVVVCCVGASSGGFLADAMAVAPLRRVRLQMLETEPFPVALSSALADADTLRYYPAYVGAPRDRLAPQTELAAAWGAQLLCVQRAGGHLTIGDTHSYDEPFAFDLDDAPYRHLLGVATSALGPLPRVERLWAGVYSQVTDDSLYYRAEVASGVVVVTGPGGRGMTMSPAIAEETFE
jgi:FAD dependent oxidoreductase TIGR03364